MLRPGADRPLTRLRSSRCGRSCMVDGLRGKGKRNHRPHLRVLGQGILYQGIVALVSIRVGERRCDLLPIQGFKALKSRGRLLSPAQALQYFG